MLSNTRCKQILNRDGIFYSDKEVETIKQVLYQIAELYYQQNNPNNKN